MKPEDAYHDNQLVVWTMRVSITFDLKAMPDRRIRDWDARSETFGQFLATAANFISVPRDPLVLHLPRIGIEWEVTWDEYARDSPNKVATALVQLVSAFEENGEQR